MMAVKIDSSSLSIRRAGGTRHAYQNQEPKWERCTEALLGFLVVASRYVVTVLSSSTVKW